MTKSAPHSVPPAAPGSFFTAIPESGVLTSGDDTLRLRDLPDGGVSGADGDDLLVLDLSRTDLAVEADAWLGFATGSRDLSYVGTLSFFDFERVSIVGGAGDDTFSGSYEGAVSFRGGAGDDLFLLRGAEALIYGGDGDDEIHGARLGDRIYGGAGNDLLVVDLSDAAQGVNLGRTTRIDGWEGIERYAGHLTHYDDTLRGGALMTDSDGGHGIDELWLDYSDLNIFSPLSGLYINSSGGSLSVTLPYTGNDGPYSVFLQRFENYRITGTANSDFIAVGEGDDLLRGGAGNDTLLGGGGRDTLLGGDGNDYLEAGTTGGSILRGGAGDDTVTAWSLDDTLSGGAGHDWLVLELYGADRGVVLGMGDDQPAWSGFEVIDGTLTGHDDVLRLTWATGSIGGGGGTDLLILDYARSPAVSISYQWDALRVLLPDDAGENFLYLHDFQLFDLRGTIGNDNLWGRDLDDRLNGYLGDDSLRGQGGDDVILGGAGNDTLGGDAGADTLLGGSGDDWLAGDLGDDHLDGSGGNDHLSGGDGNDLLDAGSGNDTLDGGNGNDTLTGAGGDDSLSGGGGRDQLYGGGGNDSLFAGGGDDLLFGGSGHDMLVGGEGDDTMSGGAGADLFRFNAVPSGNDRIEDFELSRDKLMFWQGSQLADFQIRVAVDGSARVVWANGSVLLVGVDAEALTADHFLF